MDLLELWEKLKHYGSLLQSRWYLLLISGIVFGLILALYGISKPTLFIATTTFHPQDSEQNGGMDISNPLALLAGGGLLSTDNEQILGVIKSRHLSERVAGDTVLYNDKAYLMADLVRDKVQYPFSPTSLIRRLLAGPSEEPSKKSKVISAGRMMRNMLETEIDEHNFINMKHTFNDVLVVEIISQRYIDQLKFYYKGRKTEKAQRNFSFFENRADSVKKELDIVNRKIASYYDKNKYDTQAFRQLYVRELEVKQQFLAEAYSELVISRESALAQLQQDTPVIQVLDPPEPPFSVIRPKVALYAILGLLLGIFFSAFVLFRRQLTHDIMEILNELIQSPQKEENITN